MSQSRSGHPSFTGIPIQVCLFFAANPTKTLSSSEVAQRFDILQRSVTITLSRCVSAGLLAVEKGNKQNIYRIGPETIRATQPAEYADEDDGRSVVLRRGAWEPVNRAPASWMVIA